MKPEDYPPQEPLSDFARPYHEETLRRAEGLEGSEALYGADPYQSIVVFAAPEPSRDVLAVIHGGGWTNGYKEWMSFMAPALTRRGVTIASIGYRLAPKHIFPAAVEDCADGIAWLHDHAADFGGDPARIFVGGHSAGGHHAALLAVLHDWRAARGLPANVIRGCLPISGVFDFTESSGMSMRPRFLGPEDSGAEVPASPLFNIPDVPPPFLLAWGDDDFPHLIEQAERMEKALDAAGGDTATLVLEGCDHLGASIASGDPDGPWAETAAAWMRAH